MRIPKGSYIGSLCQNEHRYNRRKKSLRYKRGACIICSKLREALRYQQNKKKIKKQVANYYKKNKESILKRQQEWYLKNDKKVKEYARIRWKNNKEAMKKDSLARYHKNKKLKK
jgi:dTDP-D-glucose 4,6-dehydratase